MEGHDADAEPLDRRALADERRVLGSDDPLTLETADDLAMVLKPLGRFPEAEKLVREVVDTSTRRLGPESALTLRAQNHLASILFYEGHAADAEKVLRPALDVERRVWGSDHPETMKARPGASAKRSDSGPNATFAPMPPATQHSASATASPPSAMS